MLSLANSLLLFPIVFLDTSERHRSLVSWANPNSMIFFAHVNMFWSLVSWANPNSMIFFAHVNMFWSLVFGLLGEPKFDDSLHKWICFGYEDGKERASLYCIWNCNLFVSSWDVLRDWQWCILFIYLFSPSTLKFWICKVFPRL